MSHKHDVLTRFIYFASLLFGYRIQTRKIGRQLSTLHFLEPPVYTNLSVRNLRILKIKLICGRMNLP